MILVIAALAVVGWLAARHPADRLPIIGLGIAIVTLAIARGYYWSIFERGQGIGWFTYNRLSALAVFLATPILATLVSRLARRQS